MSATDHYLKKYRLADVLALIQVLAIDKYSHRSEENLQRILRGKPASASTWGQVAGEHRELFRYRNDPANEYGISLLARHVTPENEQGSKELSHEFTRKLMDIAIQLHDKQVVRSKRFINWLPLFVAVISGSISLFVAFYTSGQQTKIEQLQQQAAMDKQMIDTLKQLAGAKAPGRE